MAQSEIEQPGPALLTLSKVLRTEFQILHGEFQALAASVRDSKNEHSAPRETAHELADLLSQTIRTEFQSFRGDFKSSTASVQDNTIEHSAPRETAHELADLLSKTFRTEFQSFRGEFQSLAANAQDDLSERSTSRKTAHELEDLLSKTFRTEFQSLRSEFQSLVANVQGDLNNRCVLREAARETATPPVETLCDCHVNSADIEGIAKHAEVEPQRLKAMDSLAEVPGCVNEISRPNGTPPIRPSLDYGTDEDDDDDNGRASGRQSIDERAMMEDSTTLASMRYQMESQATVPDIADAPSRTRTSASSAAMESELPVVYQKSSGKKLMKSLAHCKLSQRGALAKDLKYRRTLAKTESESLGVTGRQGPVTKIVISNWFYYVMCSFIVANSFVIGAEVDVRARNPQQDIPDVFIGIEIVFAAIFTTEILLRISVYRLGFFTQKGRLYNLFDLVLVLAQIMDMVFSVFAKIGTSASLTRSARLIRVFRLIRVMRVLRLVHVVDELRKLVYLILASFQSFCWTLLLFLILTYMFAVLFSQLVADSAAEILRDDGPNNILFQYFGSLGDSMNSLFQAVTGGIDWEILSTELMDHISVSLGVIFAAYVAFGALVILNLVTGVFVEGAMRLTKQDREEELLRKVRRVFRGFSDDDDDVELISRLDYINECDSDEMAEIFRLLEIDVNVAANLFDILDVNHDGTLTASEFVSGALNLKGPARALHVQGLFQVQLDLFDEILQDIAALKSEVREMSQQQ